jgi:hypothetical protein
MMMKRYFVFKRISIPMKKTKMAEKHTLIGEKMVEMVEMIESS